MTKVIGQLRYVLQDIKIKVKQAHGPECNVIFLVVPSVFRSFSVYFNIKKVQHEKAQHEKCTTWKEQRRSQIPQEHLTQRALQSFLTALLIFVSKLSILDVCGGPGYTSGNSATRAKCHRKNCNMLLVQQEKNAKREHCNVQKCDMKWCNT